MGRGVRFNAEKKQIGLYHSTKVFSFTMKTPCCQHLLEIHTDPRNSEYVVVAGGRRKAENRQDETRLEVDPGRSQSRPTDPLELLEIGERDKQRAEEEREVLEAMQEQSTVRFGGDVDNNRALRRAMRSARNDEKGREKRRRELGLPEHIGPLAKETEVDRLRAAAVNFGVREKGVDLKRKARRRIASSDIFSNVGGSGSRGTWVGSTMKVKKKIGSRGGGGGGGFGVKIPMARIQPKKKGG